MINDIVKPKGNLQILLTGPDGIVKTNHNVDNLVVTTGKQWIAARMYDSAEPAQMSHMAVGTDNTAADVADTTLAVEAARVALTSTTVSTNTTQYVASFPAGTGTLQLVLYFAELCSQLLTKVLMTLYLLPGLLQLTN